MRHQGIEFETTLAVLAGGAGARMGGAKDRVRIGGKTILDDLMDRLAWRGPTVLVVAPGRHQVEGRGLFGAVVEDAVGGEGPLRGVLAALEGCGTDAMVVLALDMPGIGREQVEWLMARGRGALCAMMRRERVEPFPLWIERGMLEPVQGMLARGDRAVHALGTLPGTVLVEAPEWPGRVWANLNRPEDVRKFAAQ